MGYSKGFAEHEIWQDRPNVIARPPLIVAVFLAAGFAVEGAVETPALYEPIRFLGGAGMLIAAAGLMAAAVRAFRAAGTPIETARPTETIVTAGPYAQTRNPIYVAMLLGFAGIGVIANAAPVVALVPALFAVLHFGVVRAEEHYLECKFGDRYLDYKQAVRRWM